MRAKRLYSIINRIQCSAETAGGFGTALHLMPRIKYGHFVHPNCEKAIYTDRHQVCPGPRAAPGPFTPARLLRHSLSHLIQTDQR